MSQKLMTLQELSLYLRIKEERIIDLVEKKIIVAYRIGGELLRFRKEQIDAIKSEIESRISDSDRLVPSEEDYKARERLSLLRRRKEGNTLRDRVLDFFYFNDFYIVSGMIIAALLMFIFKG